MRSSLRVAAAQPECVQDDVAANARHHAAAVRAAMARVVVFPELSLTGYQLGAPAVSLDDPALRVIRDACAETESMALVGAPIHEDGCEHIAVLSVTAAGADIVYRKIWLGNAEAVRFSAGPGPALVEVAGWRLGLAVCKDTGVHEHTRAVGGSGWTPTSPVWCIIATSSPNRTPAARPSLGVSACRWSSPGPPGLSVRSTRRRPAPPRCGQRPGTSWPAQSASPGDIARADLY